MHGLRCSITRTAASLLRRLPVRAAVSSLAMSALVVLSPAASAQSDLWNRAAAEYEVQHFAQALSLYEELARGGNARAAEMAGTMLLCGAALYGKDVPQDRARAAALLKVAAEDGRPVAALLLKRVTAAQQVALTTAVEQTVDYWTEPSPFAALPGAD